MITPFRTGERLSAAHLNAVVSAVNGLSRGLGPSPTQTTSGPTAPSLIPRRFPGRILPNGGSPGLPDYGDPRYFVQRLVPDAPESPTALVEFSDDDSGTLDPAIVTATNLAELHGNTHQLPAGLRVEVVVVRHPDTGMPGYWFSHAPGPRRVRVKQVGGVHGGTLSPVGLSTWTYALFAESDSGLTTPLTATPAAFPYRQVPATAKAAEGSLAVAIATGPGAYELIACQEVLGASVC